MRYFTWQFVRLECFGWVIGAFVEPVLGAYFANASSKVIGQPSEGAKLGFRGLALFPISFQVIEIVCSLHSMSPNAVKMNLTGLV